MAARTMVLAFVLPGVLLAGGVPVAGAQCAGILPGCGTILGSTAAVKDPGNRAPGTESRRRLVINAREKASPLTVAGNDPVSTGASVQVIVSGANGLQQQCLQLPGGSPPWTVRQTGSSLSLIYRAPTGSGPVRGLTLRQSGLSNTVTLNISMVAKFAPVDIVPPGPAAYIGLVVTFPGGGQYATNLGGTSGGIFTTNTTILAKVKKPTSKGVCPDPSTAACGNGLIDAPFETCEPGVTGSLCPDAFCGANGAPCVCPYCGDGVAAPNAPGSVPETEACDGHDTQACSEGCRRDCECAVCGNGVLDAPIEDCDAGHDALCTEIGTTCVLEDGNPTRHPAECRCLGTCGDGIINQLSESCDGGDADACGDAGCLAPGTSGECTCGTCGDGLITGSEECESDADCDNGAGTCNPETCFCQ